MASLTAPQAVLCSSPAAFSTVRRAQSGLPASSAQLSVRQPFRPALRAARMPLQITRAAAETEVEAAPEPVPADSAEAVAHLRYVRMQPSKVRRALDQIRGRTYEEALMILEYMPYRACDPILKVLVSAAANGKQNLGLRKAKLVVSEAYANEGPVLKRFRPRAQGRAYRINKFLCHITIKVKEQTA